MLLVLLIVLGSILYILAGTMIGTVAVNKDRLECAKTRSSCNRNCDHGGYYALGVIWPFVAIIALGLKLAKPRSVEFYREAIYRQKVLERQQEKFQLAIQRGASEEELMEILEPITFH